MKKLSLAILGAFFVMAASPAAQARVFVGVYGGGYGGYGGYGYPGYYSPYYAPYYVAPPPVVYAVPTAPPPVAVAPVATYPTAPQGYTTAPAYGVAPPPTPPAPLTASQTSPTFVDNYGRTCRQFQSSNGSYGTACEQADGSWRSVP